MKTPLLMDFVVDKNTNTIHVKREFDAPVALVWSAWTESELLDQWWAPKPWKAKTRTMDFREGGHWLYTMIGPEGEEHWARFNYQTIAPVQRFVADDMFCDDHGNPSAELPGGHWTVNFVAQDDATIVKLEIVHDSLSDMEKIIEMGFREGFTMALENLDELLEGNS